MNRHRTDTVAAVALIVCWSAGFVGAALATRAAPVTTVLAWRTLLAAALLGGSPDTVDPRARQGRADPGRPGHRPGHPQEPGALGAGQQ